MLCSYLLLLCSCLFLTAVYLGTKGLVHSEHELLELSVLHPLFNTEVESSKTTPLSTRDWTHQI